MTIRTTVIKTLCVAIQSDHLIVTVRQDSLEMENRALVTKKKNNNNANKKKTTNAQRVFSLPTET